MKFAPNILHAYAKIGDTTKREEGREFGFTLIFADYPLVLEVAFVTDEDHGDVVSVLDSEDLLPEVLQVIECRLRCD